MAASVPAALKAADIGRFALRAAQLEQARPAVVYWLNYWIVDRILAKGLHQRDEEAKTYTVALMDKLEQAKVNYADNDAIVDDMAGQAYIEQFGIETFERAENAMKANKVTRQSADTFQAAATFLELTQIWGPMEPEVAAKIKFAKYHALRIAKAIKSGEDPNASNPVADVATVEDEAAFSQHEEPTLPSLQTLTSDQQLYQPPSISTASSNFQAAEDFYHADTAHGNVSPLGPEDHAPSMGQGLGYSPSTSHDNNSSSSTLANDTATTNTAGMPCSSTEEPFVPSPIAPSPTTPQTSIASQPTIPSPPANLPTSSTTVSHPPPQIQPPPQSRQAPMSQQQQLSMPGVSPQVSQAPQQLKTDEQSMAQAQRHTKFAGSALTFDDVPTAVRELRAALAALGAK